MRTTEVNGLQVTLKPAIEHYIVKAMPSSNVEFYGHGPIGEIFVQFKNGKSYIYLQGGTGLVKEMLAAESIGKFVARRLVKDPNLQVVPWNERLVEPVKE